MLITVCANLVHNLVVSKLFSKFIWIFINLTKKLIYTQGTEKVIRIVENDTNARNCSLIHSKQGINTLSTYYNILFGTCSSLEYSRRLGAKIQMGATFLHFLSRLKKRPSPWRRRKTLANSNTFTQCGLPKCSEDPEVTAPLAPT